MSNRKDCFALRKNKIGAEYCDALTKRDCNNCNFYRNDLDPNEIDTAVKKYVERERIRSLYGVKRN